MFERIILLAAVIGAAYWYWSGPYQDKINPSYEAVLKTNAEDMALCMRGAAYKLGATGGGSDSTLAEQECAKQYNLYKYEGRWHRYDMKRPNQK